MNDELGASMLKSGASLKLIQTSLPPEPLPPAAVVEAPSSPVPYVQWPAVTTIVEFSSVPVHVNQPPGSANLGSLSSGR